MRERALRMRIAGVGRYLPRRVVDSEEIARRCDVSADWIRTRCGVHERRWDDVDGGERATWMGAQAAQEALAMAGLVSAEPDLILNASGTQEQAIPDGACLIQRELLAAA